MVAVLDQERIGGECDEVRGKAAVVRCQHQRKVPLRGRRVDGKQPIGQFRSARFAHGDRQRFRKRGEDVALQLRAADALGVQPGNIFADDLAQALEHGIYAFGTKVIGEELHCVCTVLLAAFQDLPGQFLNRRIVDFAKVRLLGQPQQMRPINRRLLRGGQRPLGEVGRGQMGGEFAAVHLGVAAGKLAQEIRLGFQQVLGGGDHAAHLLGVEVAELARVVEHGLEVAVADDAVLTAAAGGSIECIVITRQVGDDLLLLAQLWRRDRGRRGVAGDVVGRAVIRIVVRRTIRQLGRRHGVVVDRVVHRRCSNIDPDTGCKCPHRGGRRQLGLTLCRAVQPGRARSETSARVAGPMSHWSAAS